MSNKVIQIGYLLGIGFILASIFYFFAANWQGFDRLTKVGLSIGLLALFYGLHFLLVRWRNRQHYVSDWLLFAASLVFGLSVALIGQIYNSHADSYQLFLVWLIPVLFLAFLTKYVPFYFLSFVLFHLTVFMYLSPSAFFAVQTEGERFWTLFGLIVLNGLLFFIGRRGLLISKTIEYSAFIMVNGIFIYLVAATYADFYQWLSKGLYVVVIVGGFYYLNKTRANQSFMVLLGAFTTIFALSEGLEWMSPFFGEWAIGFFLIVAVLIISLSVLLANLLGKKDNRKLFAKLMTGFLTTIATLFATAAIFGLFLLLFQDVKWGILFFFAVIFLIAPGLWIKGPVQITYPLLLTGVILAFASSVANDGLLIYRFLMLIILGIAIFRVKSRWVRGFLYGMESIVFVTILYEWFSAQGILLGLAGASFVYYFLQKKDLVTRYMALEIGGIALLSLTVLDVSVPLQVLYNGLFLLIVLASLFVLKVDNRKWEWGSSLVFLVLFLAYKYYEFLWDLVHKSVLMFVLGVIFLTVFAYVENKMSGLPKVKARISYNLPLMIVVIFLQIGFVGYQATVNETLLRDGKPVTLKVVPVDPRSLLQGDYIRLRFAISEIEYQNNNEIAHWNRKVKVVLRENSDQVYEFAGYIESRGNWNKPYKPKPGDVIIIGEMNGPNEVVYGIETYFVPEGTGLEMENKIKFAHVRVGKSGNAILESVE